MTVRKTASTKSRSATTAKSRGRRQSGAASVAACLPTASRQEREAARRKFDCGILARGEAVGAGKPLPAGATHEIVGHRRDGSPLLKRRRFSTR